jgi:hypothetical protein
MSVGRNFSRNTLGIGVVISLAGVAACPPPLGAAESADPAVKALEQELHERDRVIEDLLRRVRLLEQRVPAAAAAAAPAERVAATPPAGPPEAPAQAGPRKAEVPAEPPKAEPPKAQAQAESPAPSPAQRPAAPGQVEVDEDAAARALERTLVATGALLLPFGQAEVEPAILYSYSEAGSDLPSLATVDKVERWEVTGTLGLRFGLPFDSQVEMAIPYNHATQKTVLQIGGARDSVDDSGHALGDVRVGLAKTMLREGAWWPDLVARVTYESDTGEKFDNGVPLDGGFNRVRGTLSAVKRQDPLAFVGGLSYDRAFESDNIRPGNRFGLSFGAVLAASPETSLRFVLEQSFIDDLKFDGEVINNSDQTQATLQLGLSTVLGRGMLFDIVAGAGLTDDSPDYFVGISIPIRFDLPVH